MDFAFSEEQTAAKELAERIFTDRCTHQRLKEVEAAADADGPFDKELWSALADAGLLGIGLPEDVGGAGLDFVAVCSVIEAAGRVSALVPVVESLACAAPTIDRFGTDKQRHWWLPSLSGGESVLTAALAELVGDVVVSGRAVPATTATRHGEKHWKLNGVKACVPAGLSADMVLVPAALIDHQGAPAGVGVFLVSPHATGVHRTRQDGTARPEALLRFDGVELTDDKLLGGPGADGARIVTYLTERAVAGLCALAAGTCTGAVALIGEYTKTREQFGKPIATFQAVGQRAADAYVDAEAIRLTAAQAAWRLASGQPAAAELAIAKYWAAEGGQRVVHAAVHLHGGVGVDRDYPLHRYFLAIRQIELTLGGANESLRRLGALMADEPA